ncbi:hypothetical protein C8Q75DRAFT_748530 [Abortiporus biennis]|nr:hypothetical protein C8Q75DRAFT_748530 [Abortiporus biennis]
MAERSAALSAPVDIQQRLCEQLILIDLLGFTSNPDRLQAPHTGRFDFSVKNPGPLKEVKETIRVLDCISLLLTTGSKEDIFAAALDKREGVCLLLAKNTTITQEDEDAISKLKVAILEALHSEHAMDAFLPFIFSRCRDHVNNIIRKIHVSALEYFGHLDDMLNLYKSSSTPSNEFKGPTADSYLKITYEDNRPPFPTCISDLLRNIVDASDMEVDPIEDVQSHHKLCRLYEVVTVFYFCRFQKKATTIPEFHSHRSMAQRFQCRISKLRKLLTGVEDIMKYIRRYFPDGNIPHRWLHPPDSPSTNPVEISLDYFDVIKRELGKWWEVLPTKDEINAQLPELEEKWTQRRLKFLASGLHVHPEIQIILYKDPGPRLTASPNGYYRPFAELLGGRKFEPIGSDRRCCVSCSTWIRAYNESCDPKWVINRSDGKAIENWGLPGDFYDDDDVGRYPGDGREFDQSDLSSVKSELSDALESWFPKYEYRKRLTDQAEYDEMIAARIRFGRLV